MHLSCAINCGCDVPLDEQHYVNIWVVVVVGPSLIKQKSESNRHKVEPHADSTQNR